MADVATQPACDCSVDNPSLITDPTLIKPTLIELTLVEPTSAQPIDFDDPYNSDPYNSDFNNSDLNDNKDYYLIFKTQQDNFDNFVKVVNKQGRELGY